MSVAGTDETAPIMRRVRELVRSAELASPFPLLSGQPLDDYLAKIFSSSEVATWGERGRVDAFVAFYCNDFENRVAFITMLIVDPSCRRKGVGRALVRFALDIARSRSFKVLRLKVSGANSGALELYRDCGFDMVEEVDGMVTMECAL